MDPNSVIKKPPTVKKWLALISAMLMHLIVPAINYFSNTNSYVAGYFKMDSGSTIVILQIWTLSETISSCTCLKVCEKIGFRTAAWICFIAFPLLHLICSFIKNYYAFAFIFSIVAGLFTGTGYLIALYVSWTYWPDKKSIVTGIILFTYGIAPSIFSPLSTAIINPKKLEQGQKGFGDNLPFLFQIYAIIYGAIGVLACLLMPAPYMTEHHEEKRLAKHILHNYNHADQKHMQAAQEVMHRNNFGANYKGFLISKKDIISVHKHELMNQVDHIGDGPHALLINFLKWDRIQDLVVPNMKFHKVTETKHEHLASWLEEQKKLHGSSMPNNIIHDYEVLKNIRLSDPGLIRKQASPTRQIISHDGEAIYKKLIEIKQKGPESFKKAIFSLSFFNVMLMTICCTLFPFFLISNWKDYYMIIFKKEGLITTDASLSLMVTYSAVSNSLSRLIIGVAILKVKLRYLMIAQNVIVVFSAFSFQSIMKSYGLGVFYLVIIWFSIGMYVTLLPTMSASIFGTTFGTQVYPLFFLGFSISSFAQYFLYAFYGKNDSSGMMFYLFGAIGTVSLLYSIFINLQPNWNNSTKPATSTSEVQETDRPMQTEGPNLKDNSLLVTGKPGEVQPNGAGAERQVLVGADLPGQHNKQFHSLQEIPMNMENKL